VPLASVAVPAGGGQGQALVTTADLNVTNASLENATIPDKYQATPTLLQVRISTNDSSLNGPKGEMAAVPWTIGFSTTSETIIIVIIGIAAICLGVWYSLKQKQK